MTGSNGPTIEPIGVVVSPVREGRDDGWGGIVSEIRIAPRFADGLQGLEQFSHVVVVFLMHEATFDPAAHLARRPRDRDDMPRLGIFAQRAKHRPTRSASPRFASSASRALRSSSADSTRSTAARFWI